MFLSDFHKECLKLARADERWMYAPEREPCTVCKRDTAYLGPAGSPCCPWCWNWKDDAEAERKPKLDPTPLPVPDLSPMKCEKCRAFKPPTLEWRWAIGKRKKRVLALGVFCKACSRWIKWGGDALKPYAPLPIDVKGTPDKTLFGVAEEVEPKMSEKERLNALDSSLGIRTTKYTPPPPENDKPTAPWELSRIEAELRFHGARLYLNEKNEVCCTQPWASIHPRIMDSILASAPRIREQIAKRTKQPL